MAREWKWPSDWPNPFQFPSVGKPNGRPNQSQGEGFPDSGNLIPEERPPPSLSLNRFHPRLKEVWPSAICRETFHPWASADGQDQDGGARRFSHASAGCFSNHPCAPAYNPFCSPNPRQPLRPDPVGPNFYSAKFLQISPLLQASRWAICLRLILV